jgi:hypothetical protein
MKTACAFLVILASAAAFAPQPAFTRTSVAVNSEEPKL